MRWSSILKKIDVVTKVQSDVSVLNYVPKQFDFGTHSAAKDYLKEKDKGSDFVMSDVLRATTGVEEIERLSEENKIENKVLEKLAKLQSEAYQKAYELGFEEGRTSAYLEKKEELGLQFEDFSKLIFSLNQIKEELMHQNESFIMKLIYDIASRIAFDHIEENQESVLNVIKKAIETAQAEENINVKVNPTQLEYVEKMKQQNSNETEFLKRIKFEGSEQVTIGSCIVETNYGIIDARVEERVEKLWNELKQAIPKVKSPIESS